MGRSVMAFEANVSLLFHRQVTPLDIILARVILEILGKLSAGFIVSILAVMLGYMKQPEDYFILYLGLLFQMAFCFATALIVAPLTERSEFFEKTISILSYLSSPLSGAFRMADWVSTNCRWIVLLSLCVVSVERIRRG